MNRGRQSSSTKRLETSHPIKPDAPVTSILGFIGSKRFRDPVCKNDVETPSQGGSNARYQGFGRIDRNVFQSGRDPNTAERYLWTTGLERVKEAFKGLTRRWDADIFPFPPFRNKAGEGPEKKSRLWSRHLHIRLCSKGRSLRFYWRPQGDLNPCCRRERPVSWTRLDDGDLEGRWWAVLDSNQRLSA